MRITLLTSTLKAGGAERAVVTLAEGLKAIGHEVSILVLNSTEPEFYHLPEGIDKYQVELSPDQLFVRWYNVPGIIIRAMAIRKAIKATSPDTVISFQDGTNEQFIMSSIGERYLKLLSCQNDISKKSHINARWDALRSVLYRRSDLIVFLDKEQARREEEKHKGWKCDGLPNPVMRIDLTPDDASNDIIRELEKFPLKIVAMGRLAPQKGFDMLLKAFSEVIKVAPQAGLVILGEGPLRSELQQQCEKLGLERNVLMPGILEKPHAVIAASDVFAFSSRFEGQGLALVEAMVCGTPPVSFDCPSGPGFIIRHGIDGLLVPAEDVEALAEALITLLLDDEKRQEMGNKAKEAGERYDVKEICTQWVSMIRELRPAIN